MLAGRAQTLHIVPGATWTAANTGLHIQAHGPGFIEEGDVLYMIGEDKTNGTFFQNIHAYSSRNLVEWKFEGSLLSQADDGDLGPNRIVERPKIIYNELTSTYVMYIHIDDADYSDARVGIATCSSLTGKYTYKGGFRPLGYESRDIGLFKDDDGSAYLLTEDRRNGLRIACLGADYLTIASEVYCWNECIESPAIWKKDGFYYIFGSHLTGWDCNDNVYSYAPRLSGPWSPWKEFAEPGSGTYESQSSAVLPFGDTALYLGDRWCPSNLAQSTYIWLPLEKNNHCIEMKDRRSWILDASSGTWKNVASESYYENDSTAPDAIFSCQFDSSMTVRTTLRVRYTNTGAKSGQATVIVNEASQQIDFLPTGSKKQGVQEMGDSVVHCNLVSGHNTISITAADPGIEILGVVGIKS